MSDAARDICLERVLARAAALADDPEAQRRVVEAEVRANRDLLLGLTGDSDAGAAAEAALVDDLIRISASDEEPPEG